jgi:ABC-type branched-chain amino acid transport systems, periplasmic component
MFIRTKTLSLAIAAAAIAGMAARASAQAQETVKIGLILPMTGGQASTGKQIDNAVKLYMQQNGDTSPARRSRSSCKDDAAVPDNTKRLAQELIVNDKVNFIAASASRPPPWRRRRSRRRQDTGSGDGRGHLDHHRALALHRAHQLHAGAVLHHHRDWAVKNGIKKVAP